MSKFRIWSSITIAAVLIATSAHAQTISKADEAILKAKLAAIRKDRLDTLPIASRIVAIGKMLLGTPYVAGTLDENPASEKLIVNLHGLDCVTFYENTLALARAARQPTTQNYLHQLTFLRYRAGKLAGYPSRLHYTTDYFYDAEQKGVLKNVTRDAGDWFVRKDDRTIDFMSQHRASYKQLTDDKNFAAIQAVEQKMHDRGAFDYIPKNNVMLMEPKIQPGDILGITTDIPGLDVSHTGIAVKESDGHIHFMHASSAMGKVIISDDPLHDYLAHNAHQTGIIVMRPLEVKTDAAIKAATRKN